MTISFGPRRGQIINALAGESYPDAWRALLQAFDALVMCAVVGIGVNDPPGSPNNGNAFTVGVGTGAWVGQDHAIAVWTTDDPATPSGVWKFYPATMGMLVYSNADAGLRVFNGADWVAVGGGGGGVSLKIGGIPNTDQTTLNLKAGANVRIVEADNRFSGHGVNIDAIFPVSINGQQVSSLNLVDSLNTTFGSGPNVGDVPINVIGMASAQALQDEIVRAMVNEQNFVITDGRVSQLPSTDVSPGKLSYVSDGRKVGEGPAGGTGVPVYFDGTQWRVFSTDAVVQD